MSRRILYYLDGYNLIHRLGWHEGESLEARRHRLVQAVKGWGVACWIVFDSRESTGKGNIQRPMRRVTVEFARGGMSADDVIVHRISTTANLNEVLVVTDDRPLARRCRFYGAKTLGNIEFLQQRESKVRESKPGPGKMLNRAEIDEWKAYFGFDTDEEVIQMLRKMGVRDEDDFKDS